MADFKYYPDSKAIVAPLTKLVSKGLRKNSFERCEVLKKKPVAVLPLTISTAAILQKAGFDSEGPINFFYPFRWEKKLPPFDHQRKTADFVTKLERGFIFNDIGTGKTLSALWAIDYLKKLGLINKVLIACTSSTTHLIWAETIFRSFPHLSAVVLDGEKARRYKRLQEDHDIYIINHEGLKVMCDWREITMSRGKKKKRKLIERCAFDQRSDIDMVLVDESSIYRNYNTQQYEALKRIAGVQSKRRLWLVSGDPMPRSPEDMWSQANLVAPGLVHPRFTRFRDQVMFKVSQFKWVPRKGWERLIYNKIGSHCIRFRRDDCIDLPEHTFSMRQCEMLPAQQDAYDEMVKRSKIEWQEGKVDGINAAVKRLKLLQISSGFVFDTKGNVHEFPVKPKLNVLQEVIEESGRKLIVFAPFIPAVKIVERFLKGQGYSFGVVHGAIPKKERNDIFRNFQFGDLQILLAHPKTMAHGLDLTSAHTVCWWSPSDDGEVVNQANGRITRPGQTCKQTVVQLVASPVDKAVYKRINEKRSVQELLMDLLTEEV